GKRYLSRSTPSYCTVVVASIAVVWVFVNMRAVIFIHRLCYIHSVLVGVGLAVVVGVGGGREASRRGGSGWVVGWGPLWSPVGGAWHGFPHPTHGRPQGSPPNPALPPPLRMFATPLSIQAISPLTSCLWRGRHR